MPVESKFDNIIEKYILISVYYFRIILNSKKSQTKGIFEGSVLVNKTWGAVKSAGTSIKSTTQQAAAIASSQMKVCFLLFWNFGFA